MKIKPFPVGYIFEAEDGSLVLTDADAVYLPDEQLDRVARLGISQQEFESSRLEKLNSLEKILAQKKITNKEETGFLYAVIVGEKIKLGRTKDTKNRFAQYSKITDNFQIIAIAESIDYIAEESEMLDFFKSYNHRGEYFSHSDRLLEEVKEYFINALRGVIHA